MSAVLEPLPLVGADRVAALLSSKPTAPKDAVPDSHEVQSHLQQHTEEELLELQREMQRLEEQLQIETKIKQGAQSMLKSFYEEGKGSEPNTEDVELQLKAAESKIAALTMQLAALKAGGAKRRKSLLHTSSNVAGGIHRRSTSSQNLSSRSSPARPRNVAGYKRAPSMGSANAFKKLADHLNDSRSNSVIIQDILLTIKSDTTSVQDKLEQLNKFALVLKTISAIDEYQPRETVVRVLRALLNDNSKDIRASTFRALRHLVVDEQAVQELYSQNIDLFIVRSLVRDTRLDTEREQALKLTRALLCIEGGADLAPRGIVTTLVAISETPDDKMASVCLETLCELAFYNIELLSMCRGVRTIFNAMLDATAEQALILSMTVAALLDTEATRSFIRPGVDLETIMAPLTDTHNSKVSNDDLKLGPSVQVITSLLKTWTGIIYLCQPETHAIRSLVDALYLPYEDTKRTILELFFEIFRLQTPEWSDDFAMALKQPSDIRNQTKLFSEHLETILPPLPGFRQDLLSNYLSVLLLAFIDGGLLEALIDISKSANKFLAVRGTILLGRILSLVDRLLPRSYAMRVQLLPSLFNLGVTFTDDTMRNNATAAISQLEKLLRSKDRPVLDQQGSNWIPFLQSQYETQQHRVSEIVSKVKLSISLQVDDTQFNALVKESLVLTEKFFHKWNWDAIDELLQGPLLNSKRVDESINNKFLRKLWSCYLPHSRQFADLPQEASSLRYVKTGCLFIETMLATNEGVKFLSDSEFLTQLATGMEELLPTSDRKSNEEPLFSSHRMEVTVTAEYFTLLGVLTSKESGLELMRRFFIFTHYYNLSELKSRDDIIRSVIVSMNYNVPGHSRILLSKALTSSSKRSRLFATNFLRLLLRSKTQGYSDWIIRFLHIQVYDPSIDVAERALLALEEACADPACSDTLVKLRPKYDHLQDVANPLILKLLSRPSGIEYLLEMDTIDKEMERWYKEGNINYVQKLEMSLSRALAATVNVSSSTIIGKRVCSSQIVSYSRDELDSSLPPHFYGELVSTKKGCDILTKSKHVSEFCSTIENHEAMSSDPEDIVKVKAALWALGHIGSKPLGVKFVEDTKTMSSIIAVAESSSVISLRGTAFYILGLISKTQPGQEVLSDFGWESVTLADEHGIPPGIAVPQSMGKFMRQRSNKFEGSWAEKQPELEQDETNANGDPAELEVLQHLGSMSNQILQSNAIKQLASLKTSNPDLFKRPQLYFDAINMLDWYHYRLNVRRSIHELFDRVTLTPEVLDAYDSRKRRRSTLIKFTAILNNENPSGVDKKAVDVKREYLIPKSTQVGFIIV